MITWKWLGVTVGYDEKRKGFFRILFPFDLQAVFSNGVY